MTIVSFASLSYNVSLFLQASALALEVLPRSEAAKAEDEKRKSSSWSGLSSFLDPPSAIPRQTTTSNVAPRQRILGFAPVPAADQYVRPSQKFRAAPSSAAGAPGPQETFDINLVGQEIPMEAISEASIDHFNVSKIFQYHDQNQLIHQ